jgi:hypothetical protein
LEFNQPIYDKVLLVTNLQDYIMVLH